MNKVLLVVLFSIFLSVIFYYIQNKSNIDDFYIIPIIVAILIKYIIGDWDKGSAYSYSDILYFLVIICVSIGTLQLLKN